MVALAEAYAVHRGIGLWRLGAIILNRTSFFVQLKEGRINCRTDTYERVLQWFSDNWPEPPEWPQGVPRPEPTPQVEEEA